MPSRVAYLGPAGTFSELAAISLWADAERSACSSLDACFAAACTTCDVAVVPIENSTEGAVGRTLDLLRESALVIVAELSLPIVHALLRRADAAGEPRVIVAHAQALAQCQRWLGEQTPHAELRAVPSNAEGARMARDDASLAAIASTHAASLFELSVVAPAIQDERDNRTRFVVVADPTRSIVPSPSGRDRTSLVVSVPNRAGAVYELLAPLASHGVSMMRFESRPARSGLWEYFFYIDVEGHAHDAVVVRALGELEARCAFYKRLGSYPRSI